MIRLTAFLMLAAVSTTTVADDWKQMFDGKSFAGWKINENPDSWKIEDGALRCQGDRSHLFYVGDDEEFTNFEFECEVKTMPEANAGIYFHTKYQDSGWPRYGYECQVNISHRDFRKSGSLYSVVDVDVPEGIKDGEWYTTKIRVEGKTVTVSINGKQLYQYTEPPTKPAYSDGFDRRLGSGTFALQAHDPGSIVYFRNLKVKRLP